MHVSAQLRGPCTRNLPDGKNAMANNKARVNQAIDACQECGIDLRDLAAAALRVAGEVDLAESVSAKVGR